MICSKFNIQVDEKEALWAFLQQILEWHTGRNEKPEYNTLKISTDSNDLYWNSRFEKNVGAFNVKLVCCMSSPYKFSSSSKGFDHKMFIEGKNDDGRIIWKQSSYDYLFEIIEDLIKKNNYEVKDFDFDGSTSEAWGILHNHQGTFIYQHSQYYSK